MKVLIADLFSEAGIAELQQIGCEVMYNDTLKGDALLEAATAFEPNVVIVRSTPVDAQFITTVPSLKIVVRAGSGYNTIDTAAAKEHGVAVCNTPGCNAVAVAELTFGLALAQDRRLPDQVRDLRDGKWRKSTYSCGLGLKGRTFGIIGFGAIGREVCRRAIAFDMNVRFFDPNVTVDAGAECGATKHEDLLDLVRHSDFVSVHVPAIPGRTVGMINEEFVLALPENGTVLNMSRGEIFDDDGVLRALAARSDVWVCSDVYNNEPKGKTADFVSPLAQHERVYGSHHTGASTEQATAAVGERAVLIVRKFKMEGEILHQVNK